jgi:hypothetical protein
MVLAPDAVSTTVPGLGGTAADPVEVEGHAHHINDPANLVRIKGHKGPHPQEYHEEVFERLFDATKRCRSMDQCREALTTELGRIAREISTPGTKLNRLVTRGP